MNPGFWSDFWSTLTAPRTDDLWVMATAALCGVACGVPGCYLVLRRMSLLADAISHAILPGLALAFLLSGSRHPMVMLAGAAAAGLITAVLSAAVSRAGRVDEGATLGLVFSTLLALGVVLITLAASSVDLDPGCVLYGLLELAPLDTTTIAGIDLPRSFVFLGAAALVNTALAGLFWKELKLVAFDPALAAAMGISAAAVHYGLLCVVAVSAVASFEAVGSILVVTMFVAPGATAHLLTDRLSRMIPLAAAAAILTAFLGYPLAVALNTSAAGSISTTAFALFVATALLAPRHGVLAAAFRRAALSARIDREDVLGLLFRWNERRASVHAGGSPSAAAPPTPPEATADDVARALRRPVRARIAILALRAQGLVRSAAATGLDAHAAALVLSPRGQRHARALVRSHRLWESFLAQRLGYPPDHVHEPSERIEHFISDEVRAELAGQVGDATDPHGIAIPGEDRQ